MKKSALLAMALVASLGIAGCSGQAAPSTDGGAASPDAASPAAQAPGEDDSIEIDEIDWTVDESVVNGNRKLSLSYTNNSTFPIIYFEIEFDQREDVTDEQRSAFDEVYSDPDYTPSAEPDEIYIVGRNEHYVEPGESADPVPCGLAYAITSPTLEQYDLMEPSIAHIRYVGNDGKVYREYYDFLNDKYSLDSNGTEETISSEAWPDSELAQMLPSFDAPAVLVDSDETDTFSFHAYGATADEFAAYVDACKEKGFTTVDYESGTSYDATNDSGYELSVAYYSSSDALSVRLEAPGA
ncbi:DUF6591 domain-containing protein [Thermophilibacter sp.]